MLRHCFPMIVLFFLVALSITQCTGAPRRRAESMQCAEYVAAGQNAPPETDSEDYSLEDENTSGNADLRPATEVPTESEIEIEGLRPLSGVVQCSGLQQHCFSVWKLDTTGNATIVRQGCWQGDNTQVACQNPHCVSDSAYNNHRFCCCSGSMCNQNTTIIVAIHVPNASDHFDDDLPFPVQPLASLWRSPLVWICLAVTSAIAVSLGLFLACSSTQKFNHDPEPLTSPSGPGFSSNAQNVDNLKLSGMIGQGKYGTVWKGIVDDKPVAVKIFPAQHKQYFVNERNIYSLSLMDSPSLLEYYGSDTRRTLSDNIEYLLVLSLAPFGCLQDWLAHNTCTFNIFTKMAKSIVRGVSHLHTDMRLGDLEKPCVCHRDLNTRNILVKSDLSCCISDFGFALKMYGSRYEFKGEIASAETKSVNEVGTLRYMAPEVLEGAVNLRDCETALKQIDVYSLGLVLWELCTRCQDWYSAEDGPPPYMSPYEAEIGKNPSFEHMQILVSRHKARPLFPANWGLFSASSRIAQDTCEDCWDHDAEARLTALCAEERIYELSVLGPTAQNSRPISPSSSAYKSVLSPIFASPVHQQDPNMHRRSMYQNNVTTAIITPPNQIIPNQGCSDVPAKVVNLQNYMPCDRNDNNFGDEGGASVEELLATCSTSCESMAPQTPSKGWYGVRALIQKNLFKKIPYKLHQRGSDEGSPIKSQLTVTPPVKQQNISPVKTAPPQLPSRPMNLVLDNQQPYVSTNTVVERRAPSTLPRDSSLRHETSRAYRNSIDNRYSLTLTSPRIGISKSATTVLQPTSDGAGLDTMGVDDDVRLKRQRSLEVFREVFGTKGSVDRLRDISQRVKTPGDVPPSVRKIRASKTLSLYDDRMMDPTMSLPGCL